ncbi:MAG: hypothetical protein ABMB14_31980, partial [Myxococcota bacterium]
TLYSAAWFDEPVTRVAPLVAPRPAPPPPVSWWTVGLLVGAVAAVSAIATTAIAVGGLALVLVAR